MSKGNTIKTRTVKVWAAESGGLCPQNVIFSLLRLLRTLKSWFQRIKCTSSNVVFSPYIFISNLTPQTACGLEIQANKERGKEKNDTHTHTQNSVRYLREQHIQGIFVEGLNPAVGDEMCGIGCGGEEGGVERERRLPWARRALFPFPKGAGLIQCWIR